MTKHQAIILPYKDHRPIIDETAFIAPTAVLVGEIEIGKYTNIWYNCTLRGDVNYIKIGQNSNIQDGTTIHVATYGPPTLIGNDVTIGHMAMIHACELQDNSFIGMMASVLDGAVVETGAMVAAGALVGPNKRVETGWLWAGVPAKPIRRLNEKDKKLMNWTVPHYVKLAEEHKRTLKDE